MTAALERIGDALTARSATVFFDALTAADEHIAHDEQTAWTASFAPPIKRFAKCPCGSTYEDRGEQIELTGDETSAAAERLADMLGRAPNDIDLQLIAGVIDAINHERASKSMDAQQDWELAHELCGEQL